MSDLRIAADVYHNFFGWAVVPVIGKRPRVAWKQAPQWQEVAERFDDPRTTGVAVILGKPSRDLVVRDFDKPEAYEQWKRDHPELAKSLPIARTGRPEGGFHVYGTMPGAPLVKLPDGELSRQRWHRLSCHRRDIRVAPSTRGSASPVGNRLR